MKIRKTTEADMQRRQELFDHGVWFQKTHGNPNQWKPGYPGQEALWQDVEQETGYVMEVDGHIVGTFALIPGEDPSYGKIEGAWKWDSPYATIHRVASDGSVNGIGDAIMDFCKSRAGHLRIDTHKDNGPMQHVILKNGFSYCGVIELSNGNGQRLAYEYMAPEEATAYTEAPGEQ